MKELIYVQTVYISVIVYLGTPWMLSWFSYRNTHFLALETETLEAGRLSKLVFCFSVIVLKNQYSKEIAV